MALTLSESIRLMLCADRLEHLCKTMDEIADIVRYMANRTADDAKEGTERCSDTKSE